MFDATVYANYLLACTVLILVPGPSQALVLARTLSGGRHAGVLTAIGLNIGTLVHSLAAALGLAAVLAASSLAFSILKYMGAAYLIYLGLAAWLARPTSRSAAVAPSNPRASLWQAIAAGLLNPKVALFFLAFLPQFVDPARGSVLAQFLVLGATMAVLDTLYECLLVALAARTRSRLIAAPALAAWRQRLSGAVLIGLGSRLALQER